MLLDIILNIGLYHYAAVSAILYLLGITGFFINYKSVINILMSLELMLLAVNINFVSFSYFIHDVEGQLFTLVILAIAAAEIAIGLAIIAIYFRNNKSLTIDTVNSIKG